MSPLSKMLLALVLALSVYAAINLLTPLILAAIVALVLYAGVLLSILYVAVKVVKWAWKH